MRNLSGILCIASLLLFINCNIKSKQTSSDRVKFEKPEFVAYEDGVLEAQKMEFIQTRDLSLGYVPQYRLIEATQKLQKERMNGNNLLRTNGLIWEERGSNTDAIGPSGNGRVSGNPVTSGRIKTIWVDLTDPTGHTVWIGGMAGGLWKTSNISASPATWNLTNDFFGNLSVKTGSNRQQFCHWSQLIYKLKYSKAIRKIHYHFI